MYKASANILELPPAQIIGTSTRQDQRCPSKRPWWVCAAASRSCHTDSCYYNIVHCNNPPWSGIEGRGSFPFCTRMRDDAMRGLALQS